MSLRSLKSDLDNLGDRLYERIEDAIEQHGLDPESAEVQAVIAAVFGEDVCKYFDEWRGV